MLRVDAHWEGSDSLLSRGKKWKKVEPRLSFKIKYILCNYVKIYSSKNQATQNLKYLLH